MTRLHDYTPLLDAARAPMALLRTDGSYVAANTAYSDLVGWPVATLLGTGATFVTHEADRDDTVRIARVLAAGQTPYARTTKRYVRRDGEIVWAEVCVSALHERDRGTVGLLSYAHPEVYRRTTPAPNREPGQLQVVATGSEDLVFFRLRLEPELCFEHVSQSTEVLSGYSTEELRERPEVIFEAVHPDDLPHLTALLNDPDEAGREQVLRWRPRHGPEVVTTVQASPILVNDRMVGIEGVLVNITRLREAEHARGASEARFRSLVQNSNDALFVTDADGAITYATPNVERMFGWDPQAAVGRLLWARVHRDDVPTLRRHFEVSSAMPFHLRVRTRAGEWRWVEVIVTNLLDDPDVAGVVVTARDVHDERTTEAALRDSTVTDVLTRLPNRTLVEDRIYQALLRHRDEPDSVAVLMVNIDRFKQLNDAIGYRAADQVLIEVGRRLTDLVPGTHTVGRFGSDEFAVCADGLGTSDDLLAYAQRIRSAMSEPIVIDERTVTIRVSIGVAVPESDAVLAEELLGRAGVAMHEARVAGGNTVVRYDPASGEGARTRQDREQELRCAADRGELVTHFQPIVDLLSGRTVSAEALIRWQHPVQGLLPPGEFISIAEETGSITSIGSWILDDACRQLAGWRRFPEHEQFTVSVNLSARQLADTTIVEEVASALSRHGLPPQALTLEVTESAALGQGHLEVLHEIHLLGVPIALDDFGTHYSSLSYLQRLPVKHLKIDRSFVSGFTETRQDHAIITGIAHLANGLGLVTVAEGVERAEEATALRLIGIDRAQGFFFARPVPADEFTRLLRGDAKSG